MEPPARNEWSRQWSLIGGGRSRGRPGPAVQAVASCAGDQSRCATVDTDSYKGEPSYGSQLFDRETAGKNG